MEEHFLETEEGKKLHKSLFNNIKPLGLFENNLKFTNLSTKKEVVLTPDISLRIRVHGINNSGKSSVAWSICNAKNTFVKFKTYSSSVGMQVYDTILPIKWGDTTKWAMIELYTTGYISEEQWVYLRFTEQKEKFEAHLVVFSMTDKATFDAALEIVIDLCTERMNNGEQFKICAVGTHVDQYQNYQVFNADIEKLINSCPNLSVCLVDTRVELTNTFSCYRVVEELFKDR